MHPATTEVNTRIDAILAQNPDLYGSRITKKAVQEEMQLELLWDIAKKLDHQTMVQAARQRAEPQYGCNKCGAHAVCQCKRSPNWQDHQE